MVLAEARWPEKLKEYSEGTPSKSWNVNWNSDSKAGPNFFGIEDRITGYGYCMWGHGVQISPNLAALVHGQDMEVGLRWGGRELYEYTYGKN